MTSLDVEALRELAHKEYEIAKLLGPSDEHEQAWLEYTERLVRLTDDYLATTREPASTAIPEPHWSTGKVDGSLGPIRHASREAAEAWIEERERIDPEGVNAGAYYLDAPEPDADDPPSQGDAATTATDAARDIAHRLAGFMADDLFDLMDERDSDGAARLTVEEQDTGRRFTVAVREEASA